MNFCHQCRNANIQPGSQYCPMCGAAVSAGSGAASTAPGGASPLSSLQGLLGPHVGQIGQLILGGLVNIAEKHAQQKLQQTLSPVEMLVGAITGGPSGPPVSSSQAPSWYEEAFREGQPKMDPTEVARRQASAQTRTRQAAQTMQMAIQSQHNAMMSIFKG